MIDRVDPAQSCIREAVCIHTKKIYDSCREEDIPLYKPQEPQAHAWGSFHTIPEKPTEINPSPTSPPSPSPNRPARPSGSADPSAGR